MNFVFQNNSPHLAQFILPRRERWQDLCRQLFYMGTSDLSHNQHLTLAPEERVGKLKNKKNLKKIRNILKSSNYNEKHIYFFINYYDCGMSK